MKLQDVCSYVADKIDNSALNKDNYISTENMMQNCGGITSASNVPVGKSTRFIEGDILFSNIRPYFKKLWRANISGGCSADVLCIRANEKINPTYLYYLLTQDSFISYVMAGTKGCKMPRGDKQYNMAWNINLPSLDVQERIAAQLSEIDDKIAVNRRICENLEAQAQALFKHWFIDFAPFKNGKFVESELGMIPEGWRVEIVDSFCKVFTGRKNTNQAEETGLYPFFSCAPEPLASNEYLYDGYAVIVAGNGSYTGRTTIYQGKFDLYQRTYACVAKEESFDTNIIFIYYMMKSSFEREKMGGTRGTSIPYIVMKDITHQAFCYNKEWIEKFSNIVRPMLEQKFRLSIESTRLSTLRDTLLPKLMSGQIKV